MKRSITYILALRILLSLSALVIGNSIYSQNWPEQTVFTVDVPYNTPVTVNVNDIAMDADGDVLSFVYYTYPEHGYWDVTDSTLYFVPNFDYCGPDSVVFDICGTDEFGGGSCVNATLYLNVLCAPTGPQLTTTSLSTAQQEVTIYINDIMDDPDGDSIYIASIVKTPAQDMFWYWTGSFFRYKPLQNYCGLDSFKFIACDVPQNAEPVTCDTFTFFMNVQCFPVLVFTAPVIVVDTLCPGETLQLQAGQATGGSGQYDYIWSITQPGTIVTEANGNANIKVGQNATQYTVSVRVKDLITTNTTANYTVGNIQVLSSIAGWLDTDSSWGGPEVIEFYFNNTPQVWNHTVTWYHGNGQGNYWDHYLGTTSLQGAISGYDIFMANRMYVDSPDYYTVVVEDNINGCSVEYTAYYTGWNMPLYDDTVLTLPAVYASDGPLEFDWRYEQDYNGNGVVDPDGTYIKVKDSITGPTLGTITFSANGNMVYNPPLDTCGTDSFYVWVCDTSAFAPVTNCDTVLLKIKINCGPSVSISVDPITCAGMNNASATAVVSNLPGVLQYVWSNNATTATISNLPPGTYSVTVSNSNGSATATTVVSAPGALTLTASVQNTACYGGADGRIQVIPNGGTSPFEYVFQGGDTVSTHIFDSLSAGDYIILVIDNNECIATDTFKVTEPALLVLNTTATATCGVGCTGTITATITGGTPPYYYGNVFQDTITVEQLCAGVYPVTARDVKGCTANASDSVHTDVSLVNISFTKQNIDCDDTTGMLTANVTNGITPYTYLWNTGDTTQTIAGLEIGAYSVTVYDATGCGTASADSITNATGINVTVANSTLPSCIGINNGTVKLSTTGGTAPYIYEWPGGISNSDTASNLATGEYTVTVMDASGCVFNYSFILLPQLTLAFNDSIVDKKCMYNQLGEILARPLNGTAPYTYLWSHNSSTIAHQTALAAGTYTYTVTDAMGCTDSNTHVVSVYSFSLSAYTIPENCLQNNGMAYARVNSGIPPYSYLWNTNPAQANDSIFNLSSGTYMVKVTDAKGCKRSGNVSVLNSCYAVIKGNVYDDANANCVRDTEDPYAVSHVVTATNGVNSYYGNSNTAGDYYIKVYQTGTYTLTATPKQCLNVCGGGPVNVTTMNTTYPGPSFGVSTSTVSHDFGLSMSATTPNPGFDIAYYIYPVRYNNNLPVNATITFNYDPAVTFISASSGGVVNTIAHTITWVVGSVPAWPSTYNLQATFNVPVAAVVGSSFLSSANIEPVANDCRASNNTAMFQSVVLGAYDPNMKEVQPKAEIFDTDSMLHYTIHFQNTGNDTTHFIIITDTLSKLVDPATVEFNAASHLPCRFDVSENGILTFTFDPIYLPDSATNEEESKGFVSYTIKKNISAEIGEVIRNTAHIYFDFNPAIVTNTTENEITTLVSVRDIKADGKLTAKVYPNPFMETAIIELSEKLEDAMLVISNLAGQVVQQYPANSTGKWQIRKDSMAQGLYTFTIYSNGVVKMRGKILAE